MLTKKTNKQTPPHQKNKQTKNKKKEFVEKIELNLRYPPLSFYDSFNYFRYFTNLKNITII